MGKFQYEKEKIHYYMRFLKKKTPKSQQEYRRFGTTE